VPPFISQKCSILLYGYDEARNSFRRGRLSMVDLLVKIACLVKGKKIFLHKRHLIGTNKYKEAHHTVPSPSVWLPWMTCQCVFALSCQANQENII
jgi:hypothetical protein